MAEKGNEIEKLKRQASDLVADMHARNLAIPAVLLIVLILAAVFVLPKSPTPPPPVNAVPVELDEGDSLKVVKAANLTLVSTRPLDDVVDDYGSYNPFKPGTKTVCVVFNTKPRSFGCKIGNTIATYWCQSSDSASVCSDETGATPSTGAPGAGDGTSAPTGGLPPTDSPGGDSKPKKTKVTYYTVDVTYDGKTYKGLEAGDQLPSSGEPIVFYAGPNSSGSKAGFVLGDNVTVQGAQADSDLGTFEISKGTEVVLTESNYQVHQLKLNKITKVTKTVTS